MAENKEVRIRRNDGEEFMVPEKDLELHMDRGIFEIVEEKKAKKEPVIQLDEEPVAEEAPVEKPKRKPAKKK